MTGKIFIINMDILETEFDKEAFKNYVLSLFMEQCCNQYKDCLAELDELNDEFENNNTLFIPFSN